jgi:hypothetical protein
VQYGPEAIQVVSSNLGDRAGVLRGATLTVINGPRGGKQTFELQWEKAEPVIAPGGWRLFAFSPLIERSKAPLQQLVLSEQNCKHAITFDVIAFDHKPQTQRIEYRCPSP